MVGPRLGTRLSVYGKGEALLLFLFFLFLSRSINIRVRAYFILMPGVSRGGWTLCISQISISWYLHQHLLFGTAGWYVPGEL